MSSSNNNIDEQFEKQVDDTIARYEELYANDSDFVNGILDKEMENTIIDSVVDDSSENLKAKFQEWRMTVTLRLIFLSNR
ncbi:hypothetical protein D3C80_1944810 [compost metagenome]